mgnify:CR=1 FL=1
MTETAIITAIILAIFAAGALSRQLEIWELRRVNRDLYRANCEARTHWGKLWQEHHKLQDDFAALVQANPAAVLEMAEAEWPEEVEL